MTKQQLQQEIKKEVKPGVKPSDLKKKLKKSKSADDILNASPLPVTNNSDPPNILLQDQLKEKQAEIESLRQQLENKNSELKETTQQLDNSLEIRANNLKDWEKQQQEIKNLEQELNENVDQASDELINQEKNIENLRSKLIKLQQTNQSLQKDLDLSQRLAESRKYPLPDNSNSNYLKHALYSLCAVTFTLWLTNNWKKYDKSPRTITNLNQF